MLLAFASSISNKKTLSAFVSEMENIAANLG